MRSIVGVPLALFAPLALASGARAFCRETTIGPDRGCECPSEGVPVYWDEQTIEYTFNERGFPGVSDAALRDVFARSFAHWTSVSCEGEPVALSVRAQRETTAMTQEYSQLAPNLNVIAHLSAVDFLNHHGKAHAFALTVTSQGGTSGRIFDADIIFNAGLGPFAVCPKDGCSDGSVDIENVATHEIGHLFGLAHSPDPDATMACTADGDDIEKRSLAADDIAGICSIYGPDAIEERAEALNTRNVHAGCGCRVLPTSGTAGALEAYASLSALLALLTLRRARSGRSGQR